MKISKKINYKMSFRNTNNVFRNSFPNKKYPPSSRDIIKVQKDISSIFYGLHRENQYYTEASEDEMNSNYITDLIEINNIIIDFLSKHKIDVETIQHDLLLKKRFPVYEPDIQNNLKVCTHDYYTAHNPNRYREEAITKSNLEILRRKFIRDKKNIASREYINIINNLIMDIDLKLNEYKLSNELELKEKIHIQEQLREKDFIDYILELQSFKNLPFSTSMSHLNKEKNSPFTVAMDKSFRKPNLSQIPIVQESFCFCDRPDCQTSIENERKHERDLSLQLEKILPPIKVTVKNSIKNYGKWYCYCGKDCPLSVYMSNKELDPKNIEMTRIFLHKDKKYFFILHIINGMVIESSILLYIDCQKYESLTQEQKIEIVEFYENNDDEKAKVFIDKYFDNTSINEDFFIEDVFDEDE